MKKINLSFLLKSSSVKGFLVGGLFMLFFVCVGTSLNAQKVQATAVESADVINVLKKYEGKYMSKTQALTQIHSEVAALSGQNPSTPEQEVDLSLRINYVNAVQASLESSTTVKQALLDAFSKVNARMADFKLSPVTATELLDFYADKLSI